MYYCEYLTLYLFENPHSLTWICNIFVVAAWCRFEICCRDILLVIIFMFRKEICSVGLAQCLIFFLYLLTCILGFLEFKKVDILWKDGPKMSRSHRRSSGELYLRVFMSENCERQRFWSAIKENCLEIMEIIDWERSHPDDIHDLTSAFGIDVARKHFLTVGYYYYFFASSLKIHNLWSSLDFLTGKLGISNADIDVCNIWHWQAYTSGAFASCCRLFISYRRVCCLKCERVGRTKKTHICLFALHASVLCCTSCFHALK